MLFTSKYLSKENTNTHKSNDIIISYSWKIVQMKANSFRDLQFSGVPWNKCRDYFESLSTTPNNSPGTGALWGTVCSGVTTSHCNWKGYHPHSK